MDSHEMQLPDNHQEVVDRFIEVCRADERILAAFLGGSYASGTADKYSDLDLMFVTTDEAYEDFINEREALVRLLGEPLFLDDFGLSHGYLFILSNGTEGEFWFGSESKFKDLYYGPYKVLLDKKGILTGQVFPKHVRDQATQIKTLRQQIDWFWHDLSHFIKAIARRQLWFAHGELSVLRQICLNLARLRHDFSDTNVGDEPHFKIERDLPIEQLSPLETTFCSMEYEAMLQAALVICRFYQDVVPKLAKEHGVTYQVDLERMLIGQLEELCMEQDKQKCSSCGERLEEKKLLSVDGSWRCTRCMYGDVEPAEIYPIGVVRSKMKAPQDRGRIADAMDEVMIELAPAQKPFMYKLEEEEYLTIVFYFHKTRPRNSLVRRKPDAKEVGLFASRAPHRFSRIAVTDVKLLRVEGTTLYVSGLDALDGSPVLDIKVAKNNWYY